MKIGMVAASTTSTSPPKMVHNGIEYLFSAMRYEFGGHEEKRP